MKKYIVLGLILIAIIIAVIFSLSSNEVIAPVAINDSNLNLVEKQNVENYLRTNIAKLSPVKAVLGGAWNVLTYTINLTNKTGTVTYEDGHIQGKKNFSYTVNEKQEVISMTIN